MIASRNLETCEAVSREVQALGRQALPVAAYAGRWEDNHRLAETAFGQFGRVDGAATEVEAVLIDHVGERGFCAGGDIRMLAERGASDGAAARVLRQRKYRLNALLFGHPKPVVAIVDGVVKGGGVRISLPPRYRIVTERTIGHAGSGHPTALCRSDQRLMNLG